MFAVIRTGGKQYKVAKDDIISVEKLLGEPGDTVELGDVLMIGGEGKAPTVGAPLLDKARVTAEIVEQGKGDKVIVFKKKRRQNYRRTRGHRQELTVLKVLEVSPAGAKAAAKKAAVKKSAAKKAGGAAEEKPAKKAPAKKPAAKKQAADDKPAPRKKAPAKKNPAKNAGKE